MGSTGPAVRLTTPADYRIFLITPPQHRSGEPR